jgi:hypothetical protein
MSLYPKVKIESSEPVLFKLLQSLSDKYEVDKRLYEFAAEQPKVSEFSCVSGTLTPFEDGVEVSLVEKLFEHYEVRPAQIEHAAAYAKSIDLLEGETTIVALGTIAYINGLKHVPAISFAKGTKKPRFGLERCSISFPKNTRFLAIK